ncbi:hypothetical protein [Mucilaginibacter ginsenosidivorax]|uniref:Uncharacterized protein n=1 Tax=Mucilaginibacter ginsenosidivorax TaxID=862126 RepID=A0A5B8W6E4_9SPHI|nr:hypothetical protein [Mucilaginibacter ginsenosidivorax]QEC78526.1 hypothetical protein FSB76_22195 [Mucilaginibacter ginsenosidivorax]
MSIDINLMVFMEFLKIIAWYYHSEAKHGYIGAAIGILLLIAASLLLKYASPLSLLKGLALPLFFGGLIFGLGGGIDGHMTEKARPQKLSLYQQNSQAFFKEEVSKVEKTHRSWFGIRLFWSAITLTGIALLFTLKKDFWIGVGLGTLFLGLLGHVEEAISMKRNERYWKEVLKSAQRYPPAVTVCGGGSRIDTGKDQEPGVNPPQKKQSSANILPNGLKHKSNLVIDTLGSVAGLAKQDSIPKAKDFSISVSADTLLPEPLAPQKQQSIVIRPDTIVQTEFIEKSDEFKLRKKKKLVDYYHSDLIGKDGMSQKHCWFNKKYIN